MRHQVYLRPALSFTLYEAIECLINGKWRFLSSGVEERDDSDLLWRYERRVKLVESIVSNLPVDAVTLLHTNHPFPTITKIGGLRLGRGTEVKYTYIIGGANALANIYTIFALGLAEEIEVNDNTPQPLLISLPELERDNIDINSFSATPTELYEYYKENFHDGDVDLDKWWWNKHVREVELQSDDEGLIYRFPLAMTFNSKLKFRFSRLMIDERAERMALQNAVNTIAHLFGEYPLTVRVVETDDLTQIKKLLMRSGRHIKLPSPR